MPPTVLQFGTTAEQRGELYCPGFTGSGYIVQDEPSARLSQTA